MKTWFYGTLLFTALILGACGGGEEGGNATEANKASETSEVSEAAEATDDHRIIAGTVVIAEILDRLNLNAVAVPDTVKDLPSRFDGLPDIGNAMDPDPEIIKSLNPTELLTVSTLEYDLKESFETYKIPADYLDLTSVEGLLTEIKDLGDRYNRNEEAIALIDELNNEIDKVQVSAADKKKPRVLILLGVPGSYLVGTEHSYAGDLVRLAGGENVMAGQEAEYLASNTEYLYNSNPDIILRLAHGMPDEVVKMFDEEFKTNDVWKHFNAVKNGRVYDLEEELFGTTAALNVSEALQVLYEIFYE